MSRRKSVNNLRKRNRLIARIIASGSSPRDGTGDDEFAALTEADRRIMHAARVLTDPHPVVSRRPLHLAGGWECGGLCVYPGPVIQLHERFMPAEQLDFGPLMTMPSFFLGKSAADIFEYLLRSKRAAAEEPVTTVDVAEFFDGNGDRASIAPNVVSDGPSFELFRETLLGIMNRRDVAAVGVEISELPNPDYPGDDDMWLSAERVFIWTTEPLKACADG
jgi:hypothetical protein